MSGIADWLTGLGLAKHVELFHANDIDLDVLPSLSEEEFKELGLSLGDRKRLMKGIAQLAATAQAAAEAKPSLEEAPAAERRQLTIVFVDLVDSTALSRALDPEDLRDAIQGYHHAVAAAIREAGGFVAKFMGDGVLAYFGYPHATEDAAERAVRAGLHVLAAVRALPAANGHRLAARAGIATGPVVVGDVIGENIAREVNVVGETPNLAARLQAVGPVDSIVIAGSTRQLIGDLFILEVLEPQRLKGFAEPVLAFRVRHERSGFSRFEATRSLSQATPFVGRALEVGLLLDRWRQAEAGDGQLVLLSGEQGIGKSRITDALWRSVAEGDNHRIRFQCTPQHSNSPLYPAITYLTATKKLNATDDNEARREAVRQAMPGLSGDQQTVIAGLLGVPLPTGSELRNVTPARKRSLLLDGLADHLMALSRAKPLLWVIEDAHWIDPTTEELISRVVDRIPSHRLLAVVTHRPDYAAPWTGSVAATQLPLNRLSRGNATALLEGLAGRLTIPPEAVDYVMTRADGVPLFMEELFQALRESGALREAGTAYELARPLDATAIPATLQDSLMARLDRLAPAKAVAQFGAAIGREFEHSLLQTISGMRPDALAEGLGQLLSAGLILSRGVPPDATYIFKHALIQDAAYASLLRRPRQEVHGRIAAALIGRARDKAPELIAHHLESAARPDEAGAWLETAGDHAAAASAGCEAIDFWRRALMSLTQEAPPDRQRIRIRLMQKLSSALTHVEGYRSAAAFELGEAALAAALELGDTELYIRVCTAKASTLLSRQDFARVKGELDQVPPDALARVDTTARMDFLGIRGVVHVHLGEFIPGIAGLGTILDIAGDDVEPDTSFGGGDVRAIAPSYLCRAQYCVGALDTALQRAEEALSKARQIGHPYSIAWTMTTLGWIQSAWGRFEAAMELFNEAMAISERYGYVGRLGEALALRATALAGRGAFDEATDSLEKGMDYWQSGSGDFSLDWMRLEPANILIENGRIDLARPFVVQAGDFFSASPERGYYAEFLRMDGLLRLADGDAAAARRRFSEAIVCATEQSAGLFRLRASRVLADLLVASGDREEARRILAPAYGGITEALTAPDMVKAKTLLDTL